ncbi:hypothetical protein LSCM1_02636 [Leishmania martiniquensis]|uniref:non-specific serine/threonine protein kinase n=1 Tax=Leishmania martiniquensis TaxID=1580590 RepID=A0A836KEC0_9TRYP|nr:hypothetical protein LSCM1_02636 [Leishmania martiniquensis]
MPSTAATQIISRGGSSPPPLATDIHISGPFLLYGPSGRLLSRYEPSDLWGLLISEHTTLNCTYAQPTVRVGRACGCDTVLSDPRVSSTHFTISLELEPYGGSSVDRTDASHVQGKLNSRNADHRERDSDGNGQAIPLLPRPLRQSNTVYTRGSPTLARSAVSAPENGPESAASDGSTSSSPLSSPATARPEQQRIAHGAIAAAETGLSKEGYSGASALSGTPLPSWRVRRVLLTDCSANGTYVNDVLVGRGEYRELHYGDDISIVRVPAKKRPCHGSATPTSLSSEENDAKQEAEEEVAYLVTKERGAKPQSGTVASSSSTAQHFATSPCDALAGCGGGAGRVGGEASEEHTSPKRDNPHVTQMFTELLSTLSTEHMYVERFCFHLYHAEEAGRSGLPIIEPEMVGAPERAATVEWDTGENGERGGDKSQNRDARVLHCKSVRFPDDPVTSFDSPKKKAEGDSSVSPTVSPSIARRGNGPPSPSSSPLPPLAPVQGETAVSAPSAPHVSALSRASSTNSSRELSRVVTPHSLLRPRPSIRESFIAPIVFPDLEGSMMPSNGSFEGAGAASTAAIRFHDSIGISPALQRKVAAQRALATRHRSSTARKRASGSLDTFGAIMKDVPADIPIRYAVLPLRHLQWGGRIGFGASGDVFMGIDVSTATVVAIKVLKGSSLFQAAPPAGAAVAAARSEASSGRPTALPVPDDATILHLSNISLGNGTVPAGRVASESLTSVSLSSASPTTALPQAAGRANEKEDAVDCKNSLPSHCTATREDDDANEESIKASETHTSLASPSAATPCATAHRGSSTALVSTSSTCHHPAKVQQQPPRPQPHDEQSASPLLRKHLREIIFLTTLQHHRIVRFLGFQFSGEGRLCLLMEYVAGGTLQTLVKNFGVFEENVIRLYTLQILEGLEYLQSKGVVHGDLKSANILASEQGSVKLTDFGTSRFLRACTAEDKGAGAEARADTEQRKAEVRRARPWEESQEVHHAPVQRTHKRNYHGNSAGTDAAAEEECGRKDASSGNLERCTDWSSFGSDKELYSDCCDSVEDEEEVEIAGKDDGTEHRVLCGTPLYMSPELIRTQEPSFASDMWALGCVVYEMATGGVLPWRSVHNLSAPAAIWYIGQRNEEDDRPSMDDVFTERSRLNPASNDQSILEAADDAHGGEDGGRRGHSSRGGSSSGGHWGRTPSPMLLDLLQSTLSINPALRPTPSELLQHPFIRNEASKAALDRWHAVLAANRHTPSQTRKPHDEAKEDGVAHRKMKAELGATTKSTPRSVCGSPGSAFETSVVVANNNRSSSSRDGSLHARASRSPQRTSPSLQRTHMEELSDSAPAKLGGENPPSASLKQKGHRLHTPPLLGEPATSPSTGTPLSGSGGPSVNLLGDSWEDVKPSSLLPLPTPASQPKPHSSQAPSVLGVGHPDSQPLIYEPPQLLHMRGHPMGAPGLMCGAPCSAAVAQWLAPQSFSAPTNLSDPRSCAPAANPVRMQQVPYSMPAMRQGSSNSYLRQHQLFLKQNELERRRLLLLVPHGRRPMRGRFRAEGASPPQQHGLPASSAPVQAAAGIVPLCPPSYPYAMQQPVLEYSPGYSDYNPQVNTQTVEMRLPPDFTSQSLSVSQQQGGQQKGRSDTNRWVAGVRLPRLPSSQRPLSQQLRGSKARHSSRRERARSALSTTAAVSLSPSLRPEGRSLVTEMHPSHVRGCVAAASVPVSSGPVLSHASQQLVPQLHLSIQAPRPAAGGLTIEMDNLSISSPLVPSLAATAPPLPLKDHDYQLGCKRVRVPVDQPASKPPQPHCEGPVLPSPPHPCHDSTIQPQSTATCRLGPGGGDGCGAAKQASPANAAAVGEEEGVGAAQQSVRRGRQGRRKASASSRLLLHQSRLRNAQRASPLLKQQLSLRRIQTRVVEHISKQQPQEAPRLSEEAASSQQQENPCSTKQLLAARPTRQSSSAHTSSKKRRMRPSPRTSMRAVSRRRQQRTQSSEEATRKK